MPTLYLRLVVLPLVTFAIALLVIRAQPFDDREPRAAVLSETCASPCFMGIRPGMPVGEAVAILQAHPWVSEVINRTVQNTGGYIFWWWEPDAPAWIDTSQRGTIWVNNRQVDQFWLDTRYPLGEWLVQLGPPDINILDDKIVTNRGIYQYRGVHAALGVVVMSWQRCVTGDPYHGGSSIKFRKVIEADELAAMMYLDQWAYRFNNCG
ncbi:MAG: hypothetical protein LCI00_32745 [Chloroflexi bacterium]|nr:hypothetical protein [Chloroflexota bacterium]